MRLIPITFNSLRHGLTLRLDTLYIAAEPFATSVASLRPGDPRPYTHRGLQYVRKCELKVEKSTQETGGLNTAQV